MYFRFWSVFRPPACDAPIHLFVVLLLGSAIYIGSASASCGVATWGKSLPDNPANYCCRYGSSLNEAGGVLEVNSISQCIEAGKPHCDYRAFSISGAKSFYRNYIYEDMGSGWISGVPVQYGEAWCVYYSFENGYYTHHLAGEWYGTPFYIKVVPAVGTPESGSVITSVQPGSRFAPGIVDTAALVARVYDWQNQLIPDVSVELNADVVANSGGHAHDDDTRHYLYSGRLSPMGIEGGATVSNNGRTLTGNTGSSGLLFRFSAPAFPHNVAGDHTITARCNDRTCRQFGPKIVWVGIKDLVEIPETDSEAPWHLYGHKIKGTDTPTMHPGSHFLTPESVLNLIILARSYHDKFPTAPPLQLNDASLERGGLFDLYPNWPAWSKPHAEHSYGTAIDIKANGEQDAIPSENYGWVIRFIARHGMDWFEPDLVRRGHFHIRLMGIAQ